MANFHDVRFPASISFGSMGGIERRTEIVELVNIGTLFAFILVSIGVLILRRTRPDLPRSFRTPAAPVVASLAVLLCVYLMLNLTGATWIRFLIWMGLGFIVYFGYSRRNSRLGQRVAAGETTNRGA